MSTGRRDRYREGIQQLDAELADRLRDVLSTEPAISKAELARRVGVSRATVGYYLRQMGDEVQAAAIKHEEIQQRVAMTQLDLVDKVATAAAEVCAEIGKLRASPTSPAVASVTFRGYAVLERLYHLLGELIGEVAPPTQNIYVAKVEAMLSASIDPMQLPAAIRTTVGPRQ